MESILVDNAKKCNRPLQWTKRFLCLPAAPAEQGTVELYFGEGFTPEQEDREVKKVGGRFV